MVARKIADGPKGLQVADPGKNISYRDLIVEFTRYPDTIPEQGFPQTGLGIHQQYLRIIFEQGRGQNGAGGPNPHDGYL